MRILMTTLALVLCCAIAPAAAITAAGSETDAAGAAHGVTGRSPEVLDAAYAAWRGQKWTELEPYTDVLTAENPYNGAVWYAAGDACYNLKKYAKGAAAYGKAAELGFLRGGALYNRACCLALSGQGDLAVDAVEAAIRAGLQDRENLIRQDGDLASIRDTDAFRARILPRVPEGVSRADGWRIDLEYMHKRMEETHYDLYANITREEWRGTLDRLEANAASMSDNDIIFELYKLFAKIGDGHTGVIPPTGEGGWHALAIDLYVFTDGIFVRKADARYADVVGKRLVKIGRATADEAYQAFTTVTQHDNTQQYKWLTPYYMTVPELLKGFGFIDDVEHVDIVVEDADGRRTAATIGTVAFTRYVHGRQFDNEVTMRDHAPGPKPLWAKYADMDNVHYAYEYLPDEKMVYFWFDSVRDADHGESIADFSKRLFDFIAANDVSALVIDVRRNHGGNNHLTRPIINGIIASDKIGGFGSLIVITGRETFSACQNFVNRLDAQVEPVFVGEPTASRPNFVGEDNKIQLPWSGLVVRGSSRYWQDAVSEDARPWIAPHLVAEMSSADYASNRDPAMDAIRAYLAHRADATAAGAR